MWGCGILSGAWTVCGQVSLSSTRFAFPTIQKERFIFDRRERGQDIEGRRECERERRGKDTYWQDDFCSTRDESWSITVLFIFVSHWSWSGLLTNSGQWDTKGCLPGVSQKIILTDRGLFTGRETHFFLPLSFLLVTLSCEIANLNTHMPFSLHPWVEMLPVPRGWQNGKAEVPWVPSDGTALLNQPWSSLHSDFLLELII